jgi:hypothetical protein
MNRIAIWRSELRTRDYMICATQAGFVVATLTNPIWVVKTRMILPPPKGVEKYPNIFGKLVITAMNWNI